jgi:rare lipoprotein A
LKLGSLIILATTSLAFAGPAFAQGGRAPNVNPLQVLFTQMAEPPAKLAKTAGPSADAQIVRASWYGGGERLSAHTSSGEIFRPMGQTAAHRTLPFGTLLRVSSLSTGRSTVVRINDRGPAAATGRALDLSHGAALALGIASSGEAKVAIEVVH